MPSVFQNPSTRMEEEGRTVPQWVKDMVASGRTSFYARNDDGGMDYATLAGTVDLIPNNPKEISLDDLRATGKEIQRNTSASLLDLGDGALCLEFPL